MSVISASHSVLAPLVSVVNGGGSTWQASPPSAAARRDVVVNRILDWCCAARASGRNERAERLLCLAWEAYDRLPA